MHRRQEQQKLKQRRYSALQALVSGRVWRLALTYWGMTIGLYTLAKIDTETMISTRVLRFNSVQNNQPGKNRINWLIAPVLTLFHVGAVAAPFFFTWNALFVAIFLYWVTTGLGLGICYHRLLTHRSYTTPRWFEYFLTVCGVTALEGGPLLW